MKTDRPSRAEDPLLVDICIWGSLFLSVAIPVAILIIDLFGRS